MSCAGGSGRQEIPPKLGWFVPPAVMCSWCEGTKAVTLSLVLNLVLSFGSRGLSFGSHGQP